MAIHQVCVESWAGERMIVDLLVGQLKSMTVLQLKERIKQRLPGREDVENLRLIFTDKFLDDDSRLLCEYGIQHKSVIRLVMKVPGGGPPPLPPDRGDGGMGDKDGQNRSMEKLSNFHSCN